MAIESHTERRLASMVVHVLYSTASKGFRSVEALLESRFGAVARVLTEWSGHGQDLLRLILDGARTGLLTARGDESNRSAASRDQLSQQCAG